MDREKTRKGAGIWKHKLGGGSGRKGKRKAWGGEDRPLKIMSIWEVQSFPSYQMVTSELVVRALFQEYREPWNGSGTNRDWRKVSSILKDCRKSRADAQGARVLNWGDPSGSGRADLKWDFLQYSAYCVFLVYRMTNVTHTEFVLQNHQMLPTVTVAQFELCPKHIRCYEIAKCSMGSNISNWAHRIRLLWNMILTFLLCSRILCILLKPVKPQNFIEPLQSSQYL